MTVTKTNMNRINIFSCNNAIRVASLILLSSLASSIHALPVYDEVDELIAATDSATVQAGNIPLAPPGPYFSSATPKETAISKPIQMPASVPVDEKSDELLEKDAKVPAQLLSTDSLKHGADSKTPNQQSEMVETNRNMQAENNQAHDIVTTTQDQKTKQRQRASDIELTNPLAEWPSSVEPNSQWAAPPPAPPGPYGFVPNYTPRSADRYRYRNPYNPGNNFYNAPYGRSAPGMMSPQMGSGYSNPNFSNQGYYYGYPNPGGYNQGRFNQGSFNQGSFNQGSHNRGGFDPRLKRNNLNQNDMNQAKPKK